MSRFVYNVPAEKGTWISYKLLERGTHQATAWFACHQGTDPVRELHRIIEVAGSPYEMEGGKFQHDRESAAEDIFVINRYD